MTVPTRQTALVALVATLAIQVYTAVVASAPAVLAPVLAPDLGITPVWIGVFVGIMYTGAMLGSLGCGEFIARYGAIRVSQACVLICAVGMALMALVPGSAEPLLVVTAFAMGFGYGPITAASSEVLVRTTPPSRMALTFSIKQTGVPAGAALAGAVLPGLALLAGWRATFLAVAVLGVVVMLAAQPTRRALDVRHPSRPSFCLATIFAPLKSVLASPPLLELSLVGCAFAAVQVCLTAFLVVFLTDALQWSLVASGLALTFATASAIPGRILWAVAADRALPPNRILALIGILTACFALAFAFATPAWPAFVVLPLAALFGATAIGWNGVQLSELARRAPPGTAGAVTGASGFVTFGGVVTGPLLFAGLAGATGSYRAGFVMCAAISATAAAVLLRRGRGPPRG
ncbi:MAG: MFS transporter [Betaproteobacteria bacterium]